MCLLEITLLVPHIDFSLVNSYGQGDLLFSDRNMTLSVGDRTCFDVVIIDDDLSEYSEVFTLQIGLRNGSYHRYYSDTARIRVLDNDGEYYITNMALYGCMML